MAFKLPDSITNFLKSKELSTVLDLLQYVPLPIVGTMAKTLETVKDTIIQTRAYKALPPETQKEFMDMYALESARLAQQDLADIERLKVMLGDTADARRRQIAILQMNGKDWLFFITGCAGIGGFLWIIYAAIFINIPVTNRDMFNILMGNVMGIALTIFTFYFGSSKGSQEKDKTITELSK